MQSRTRRRKRFLPWARAASKPPGQPRHLASAIRLLLDDPALARGLGLRARELILERYRYEHGAETLGALFERVRARGARLIQRGQPC